MQNEDSLGENMERKEAIKVYGEKVVKEVERGLYGAGVVIKDYDQLMHRCSKAEIRTTLTLYFLGGFCALVGWITPRLPSRVAIMSFIYALFVISLISAWLHSRRYRPKKVTA